MKRTVLLFTIIALLAMLTGCKSLFTREGNLLIDARNAESAGNYAAAVVNAAESIRIDNQYAEAIIFLRDLYPRANDYYLQKLDEKKNSDRRFINDEITAVYNSLYSLNEAVRTLPPVLDPQSKAQLSFPYTDYKAALNQSKEMAAEDHYQEGLKLMKLKGRENAKSAAGEFEAALSFVPGYKDAEKRKTEAVEEGIQVIAFFTFKNNAWNIPTENFSDLVQNRTISALLADPQVMKFTRIIDRDMQASLLQEQIGSMNAMMDDESRVEIGELLNANIFITGTIDAAALEGPSTSMVQEHRSVTKESSDSTIQESDDATTKDKRNSASTTKSSASQTLEADVFIYTKAITFNVTVSYKAVDVETGAILLSNTININRDDSIEWADYRGDSDALTGNDHFLLGKSESSISSPEQIASEAASEVGEALAADLKKILK